MKVFISWSGERSQALAQALREWLPLVVHFVEPWVSQSDIDAGDRWAAEVAKELDASNFGIICVTSENVSSPWILFEAGALSKSMQEGRVIPLLLDLEFKNITGPIAQFQAKKLESAGLWDIVSAVNRFGAQPVPDARLKQLFDALWSELEKKVAEIPTVAKQAKAMRPQQEILEELVSGVRGLDSRFRDIMEDGSRARQRRGRFHAGMIEKMMHLMELELRDPIRYIFLGSMMKDDFPWLYDLAVDAYREACKSGRSKEARRRFFSCLRMLRHGPLIDSINDKEMYYIFRETEYLLREMEEEFLESAPLKGIDRKLRPHLE